jgi:hypothetical protein
MAKQLKEKYPKLEVTQCKDGAIKVSGDVSCFDNVENVNELLNSLKEKEMISISSRKNKEK